MTGHVAGGGREVKGVGWAIARCSHAKETTAVGCGNDHGVGRAKTGWLVSREKRAPNNKDTMSVTRMSCTHHKSKERSSSKEDSRDSDWRKNKRENSGPSTWTNDVGRMRVAPRGHASAHPVARRKTHATLPVIPQRQIERGRHGAPFEKHL